MNKLLNIFSKKVGKKTQKKTPTEKLITRFHRKAHKTPKERGIIPVLLIVT